MKLEVKDLHKVFGETEVLHGISFTAQSGKAFGLLGRNGAGKTTTIRILMDVFKANKGTITLDGKTFYATDYQLGYLPEERGLYPKKGVMEQIVYLAMLRGIDRKQAKENATHWLTRLEVMEYAGRKLETLSKGNQQKVQIAQTLVCNPEIVILDEPFSGLDPVNSQVLKDVIRELIAEDRIVIFSSHQMGYVEEFCEDIIIINKGTAVLEGNLNEIKKEFGKNRLIISATNYSLEELSNMLEAGFSDMIRIDKVKQDGIVIELTNDTTKNQLLESIMQTKIDIDQFGMYKPTLTDIFVLKAGDEK